MQTVLATFDDQQTAQAAIDQLVAQGFSRTSVHLQSGASSPTSASASAATANTGFMASVGHFFENLFSSDEKEHAGNYAEAVRRGSTVVAVDASTDAEVTKAQTLMQKLGTVDLDDRAAQWKSRGWNGFDPNAAPLSDDELAFERDSVPVVQEELVVGKRTMDVGGLRVVKRKSETPVSEMINLRQEKATIQRKPVDRAATEADFQNFKEGTFEVRETAEEAVIGKTARVVEEVSIGKEVTNRTEKVADSVRRTDVDVERIPGTKDEITTGKVGL
ncbi:MAG TPA: YsnF/AvaK domain-containing protein [Steroidobacteraceae bacterium]